LGSEADAAAGAPQGWHDVQTLLAQKGAAELLATYLDQVDAWSVDLRLVRDGVF
jgi:hypothetical protein